MTTCEHDFDDRYCPYCRGNIRGDRRQREQSAQRAKHLCTECGFKLADALVAANETMHPTCDPEHKVPINRNTAALSSAAPATSAAAAAKVLPNSGTKRRMVYDLLTETGGLCDHEIEERTGWLHQSASAARNSLMNDGWVVASARRRKTSTGLDAIVWEAVPETRKEPANVPDSTGDGERHHDEPPLPLL